MKVYYFPQLWSEPTHDLPRDLEAVCKHIVNHFGISKHAVISRSRNSQIVAARIEISVYLRGLGYTFEQIGSVLVKNYSTVIFYTNYSKGSEYADLIKKSIESWEAKK